MRNILALLVLLSLISACEQEIELDLNSADPQLVIEGEITNETRPYQVKITQTVNFSDANSFPAVRGAKVSISDDAGFSEELQELEPGIYKTAKLKGQAGRTYTLRVETVGKTYTAVSKMPEEVPFQRIETEKIEFGFGGTNGEDLYSSKPIFSDPPSFGNNYRFVQYRNGERDPSIIVFNDNVNNGQVNERPILSPNFEVGLGDTLLIEMRCIDKVTYDYFFTLSQIAGQGPGGGTTPANPPNNFSGKVLGYFSAHTVQRQEVIIK